MLYEGLLIFGVVFVAIVLAFVAAYFFGALRSSGDTMGNGRALQAFLFVVLGIYFTWLWSRGQTLAMKTWHIRVVDSQGHALTQRRALVRYLWAWLWFLPPLAACAPFHLSGAESAVIVFGWMAVWAVLSRFHPQQQFWHDALAGTRLVSCAPVKP
jgi:uncharacterized RDD family membrane protein YckC